MSQGFLVPDAGEQPKTLYKISQSIIIDTESLMQALHFYFMHQLIQKRAKFIIIFLKAVEIGIRARGTLLTVTISLQCFQMGMTTAVSRANCEFWPFLSLKHQACYNNSICRPINYNTAPAACGKTKCKWHSLLYQIIRLGKPQ